MCKYVFPAIFTKEDNSYSVRFPDVAGCYTQGSNLPEAMEMAADALALMLTVYEDEKTQIPAATDIKAISATELETVSLISCDTVTYRKLYGSQAVKKTLTIPQWLNTMAERENVNFSQILQKSLMKELHING